MKDSDKFTKGDKVTFDSKVGKLTGTYIEVHTVPWGIGVKDVHIVEAFPFSPDMPVRCIVPLGCLKAIKAAIIALFIFSTPAFAQGMNYDDDTYWAMRKDSDNQRACRYEEQSLQQRIATLEYLNAELRRENERLKAVQGK